MVLVLAWCYQSLVMLLLLVVLKAIRHAKRVLRVVYHERGSVACSVVYMATAIDTANLKRKPQLSKSESYKASKSKEI